MTIRKRLNALNFGIPPLRNGPAGLPMCRRFGETIETTYIPGYSSNSALKCLLSDTDNDFTNRSLSQRMTGLTTTSDALEDGFDDPDEELQYSPLELVKVSSILAFINCMLHSGEILENGINDLKGVESISIRVAAEPGFITFGSIALEVMQIVNAIFEFASEDEVPLIDVYGVSGLPQGDAVVAKVRFKV